MVDKHEDAADLQDCERLDTPLGVRALYPA